MALFRSSLGISLAFHPYFSQRRCPRNEIDVSPMRTVPLTGHNVLYTQTSCLVEQTRTALFQ